MAHCLLYQSTYWLRAVHLAELLGVSRQSLEGWKSGKAPSKDNQHRLDVLYQAAQRFEAAGLEANLSTKRRLMDSELEFMQALAHDRDPLDAVRRITELVERGKKQRAALEFFRGQWTIKGHESTYRESCDWLAGNGFVACHAEDQSETTPSFSMSVFGYSETDGQYTYNGFSSSGTQRSLQGHLKDGVWRFYGQSDRGPHWRRWQVTITPTPEGFHFREEVSDRSGPWKVAVELWYLRKATAESNQLLP